MPSKLIYASAASAHEHHSVSANGHTANDRTPYCYLIGWPELDMWYYGRRTATGCHPSEFWSKYFTSSDHVKNYVNDNGPPTVMIIRKVFSTIDECKSWETRVLRRMNAAKNPRFLNRRNGDIDYDTSGIVYVTHIESGRLVSISQQEYDENKDKYSFHTANMMTVQDFEGTLYAASKIALIGKTNEGQVALRGENATVTMYSSDTNFGNHTQYISHKVKKSWYVDLITGSPIKCLPNNPLILTGDYQKIPHKKYVYDTGTTGFIYAYADDDDVVLNGYVGIESELVEAISDVGDKIYTHRSDILLLDGIYSTIPDTRVPRPTMQRKIPVKDSLGNTSHVSTNDPRLKSGELKRTLDGYVAVKDSEGNRFSVQSDDPRLKSGELVGANKGTKTYRNILSGKVYRMEPTDPRILLDEYVPHDITENRKRLISRPEVQELLAIAKAKNIRLYPGWTYANDISKARDFILNSPPGTSAYKNGRPKPPSN